MDQQALSYFVAGNAYLFMKMFANTGVQVASRMRHKTHKYREDAPLYKTPACPEEPQPEILTRADAAWRNDLENIPMFIVAALCGLMTGLSPQIYGALILAFCVGRTAHTVCLLLALQPWRGLGYGTGIVTTGMMFILSLRQLGW